MFKYALFVLALATAVYAQAPKVTETTQRPLEKPVTPPAVLKFDVSFTGDNAGKVNRFILNMSKQEAAKEDQTGFATAFDSGQIQVTSAVSHAEVKIPDNAASGSYRITAVAWTATNIRIDYDPDKVGLPPIHIDNPAKFEPPKIKVTEQP